MGKTDDLFRNAFEKTLLEHGFSQTNNMENIYQLSWNNNPDQVVTAQFLVSEPIDELIHGSHNGNKIQAIGYFKFRLPPPGVSEPEIFIFGFHNLPNDCVEFIIIPTNEMKRRLRSRNRSKNEDQIIELQFWLMNDNTVFQTKDFSGEGEWWLINGRMAEDTDLDYSEFLNNWDGMKMT